MEWKPNRWLAAVLSLPFAPLGLLYVQRPRWAIVYLVATIAIQALVILLLFFGATLASVGLGLMAVWVLNIAAVVHAFRVASASELTSTRQWYSRWHGLLAVAVAWYSGTLLFRAFLFEPYRYPSEAMYPNIREGALVLAAKRGYGNYRTLGLTFLRTAPSVTVKRGQIVLFQTPGDEETVFVKRVIGLPGDHVECRNRRLIINGTAVPTTPAGSDDQYEYVDEVLDGETVRIAHMQLPGVRDCDEVVPPGHYFVLGDSRSNSRDSRYFGTVPRENLIGGVAALFQPK